MSIPSTSITFNDDDTAWWVVEPVHRLGVTNTVGDDYDDPSWFATLDRPCDTCGGDCEDGPNYHTPIAWHCRACINGRHTFEIEVIDHPRDLTERGSITTYRVSVVEGMVLPIVEPTDLGAITPHAPFVEVWKDCIAIAWIDGHNDGVTTLPPDAAPDKWAVKLQVQP